MFKKPIFWIVFTIIVVVATVFCLQNFDELMGFISLDITMDRNEALASAKKDMAEWELGPDDYRQAVIFREDSFLQYYIELEAGGKEAYNQFLADGLYQPYKWSVRHFKPGEENEVRVYYTPDGKLYAFSEKVPESEERPSLKESEAKALAVSAAEKLDIKLGEFELIETKTNETISGRTDYSFVYERPQLLGEARYRLSIEIAGNKASEVIRYMHTPEAFSRRYREMRSANNTIASTASYAMLFLYGLLGIGLGSFLLLKSRYLLYKKAVLWAFVVSFAGFLAGFNQLPLSWFWYDTAVSPTNHITQTVMMNFMGFMQDFILLAISFIAAESLTRKAFPGKLQFWKNLDPKSAPSLEQLGNTLGAYGLVAVNLAFVLSFYLFTAKNLGWWSPGGLQVNPNFIAMPMPWLSVLSQALHAGFWEEALFRAVPLAGMILIGRQLKKEKLFLILGLIIQALIFSAGHANYAAQPSYARVVELIIPSLLFAFLYLRFGLYTGIILHFVFDAVLMAMYIWIMKAPGIWINRVLVLVGILLPLIIILYYRLKNKKWREIPEELLNRSWKPKPAVQKKEKIIVPQTGTWDKRSFVYILIAAIFSVIFWALLSDFTPDQPDFNLSRAKAVKIAEIAFDAQEGVSDLEWRSDAMINSYNSYQDKFVWQNGGKEIYRDAIGDFVKEPFWQVSFRSFSGDVVHRAETYNYSINNEGEIIGFSHQLPESRAGASLDEAEARNTALSFTSDFFNIPSDLLTEVSASPRKLPERTDWNFTWKDTLSYPLKEGEWRYSAVVRGNQVMNVSSYTYVPQEWIRNDRNRVNAKIVYSSVTSILSILLYLAIAIMAVVSWSHGGLNKKIFLFIILLMILSSLLLSINKWQEAVAGFSTSEPWEHQVLQYILGSFVQVVALSFIFAMIAGFLGSQNENSNEKLSLVPVIISAVAFGTIAVIAELINPMHQPWKPSINEMNHFLPLLTTILQTFSRFVTSTILMIFILQILKKLTQASKGFLGFIMIFLFLMITSTVSPVYGEFADYAYVILAVILRTVLLLFVFCKVLKYDLSTIPVFMAVAVTMVNWKMLLADTTGISLISNLLAVLLTIILALQWTRLLRCDKK